MRDRSIGPQGLWILLVMVASVGFGLTPVFVRWLDLGGVDAPLIAFYRYAFTAVLLLPFLGLGPRSFRLTLLGIGVGVVMGFGWIGYIRLLEQTSVATAGVFYLSYPLFTLIFALILLRQVPGLNMLLAAILVLAAGYMIATPRMLNTLTPELVLTALAAPASFGLGITVLTGWLVGLNPLQRLACVPLGAALGLLPMVLMDRAPEALLPTPELWPTVLGLALVTALLPQFVYVVAAPRVGAGRAAIAGSIELPVMMVLGLLIFMEEPSEREIIAGALVVLAVVIAGFSRQPNGRPPNA
ncbi:MAG: DMT family transporter [Pseudomonadota bacterium]